MFRRLTYDLIEVDFRKSAVNFQPLSDDTFSFFFPGRTVFVDSVQNAWLGVICSIEEWKLFLAALEVSAQGMPFLPDPALAVKYLNTEFDRFLVSVENSLFSRVIVPAR